MMYIYGLNAPRGNAALIPVAVIVFIFYGGTVVGLNNENYGISLSPQQFFQLRRQESDFCLSLSDQQGRLSDCTNKVGDISDLTVFRLHGTPGNQQIELFGSGQCLDREHCHSSTSNLRSSHCSHCGAIHWDLRNDGTLREDRGLNCIYVVESAQTVAVHHSSDGCTSFIVTVLGDSLHLKSIGHGDCLSNGVFGDCALAPKLIIFGLPYYYQLRDIYTGYCLDREHCHFSTSNIRRFDCTHCGAIHWAIVGTKVGEDDMSNCVNRGPDNSAVMNHCSEGWEKIICEVLQTTYVPFDETDSSSFVTGFPKADVPKYIENMSTLRLRGLRFYRDNLDGTAQFEFVQAIPIQDSFSVVTNLGIYQVRYWVVTITTKAPHDGENHRDLIGKLMRSQNDEIADVDVRYGAVDKYRRHFGESDGLLSLFVTDKDTPAGDISPGSYHIILLQFANELRQIKWWQTPLSVHHHTYEQSYRNFAGDTQFYQALYWPKV